MIIIILSVITFLFPLKSIEVVEMTSDAVNIRTKMSINSRVICRAEKGETFKYIETIGNWYEIEMYSADYRYIHKSTAKITKKTNRFSLTDSQVKIFIAELGNLEDRAARDSGGWESGTDQSVALERELIDCYKLKLFREKNIITHLYRAIFDYAFENKLY